MPKVCKEVFHPCAIETTHIIIFLLVATQFLTTNVFLWLQVCISLSPVFRSARSSRFAQLILAKLLLYAGLRNLCSLCRRHILCNLCGNTEDRSCPVRPVWSGLCTTCIQPLKPSAPISLRSSFHFIVYVRLCVCVCVCGVRVFVCLHVCVCLCHIPMPSIPSQSRRGVAAFGVVSSIIRRQLRNGALPPMPYDRPSALVMVINTMQACTAEAQQLNKSINLNFAKQSTCNETPQSLLNYHGGLKSFGEYAYTSMAKQGECKTPAPS